MIVMKEKLFFLSILLLLIAFSSSCTRLGRFVFYNFADIKDYKKFPKRELSKSETPFHFAEAAVPKKPTITWKGESVPLEDALEKNKTVAFLIIRNDTILYEKYLNKYDTAAIVPSFSMAKSVTSMLIGCAIEDGLINSVEEPVTNYIPELKKNGFDSVKIRHLLQMTAGIKFDEGYFNPFGHVATFYYGLHLRKNAQKLKLERAPGTKFQYVSGETQLLGLILEKVLAGKTITTYLQEKIWTPLGMEYDASWSIDQKKNGIEKTFCCLNARARDFAKLGRLYLNKGNWDGQQLIPEQWVETSTKVDREEGSSPYYQYQWWMTTLKGDYMAQGILGQYIYINPAKNIVIVRLGKNYGNANWRSVFVGLAKAL